MAVQTHNQTASFIRYEPPRSLPEIESDIRVLKSEIVAMLAELTGSAEVIE